MVLAAVDARPANEKPALGVVGSAVKPRSRRVLLHPAVLCVARRVVDEECLLWERLPVLELWVLHVQSSGHQVVLVACGGGRVRHARIRPFAV